MRACVRACVSYDAYVHTREDRDSSFTAAFFGVGGLGFKRLPPYIQHATRVRNERSRYVRERTILIPLPISFLLLSFSVLLYLVRSLVFFLFLIPLLVLFFFSTTMLHGSFVLLPSCLLVSGFYRSFFFYLPLTLFFPPFFLIPTAQRYPRSATLGNEACAHVCAYTTRTRDIASWYLLLLHACPISVLFPSLSIPLTLFAPTPPRCFHFPPLSLSFYRVTRETRSRCSQFVSFFGERPTPMRESATSILIVLYVRDIRTYTRVCVRSFLASFRARENTRGGSSGCLTRTKWI